MRTPRRHALAYICAAPFLALATRGQAQTAEIWSAREAFEVLQEDGLRLLDIRSREEWAETGLARGAWPVSMHEKRFPSRLFAARDLAGARPIGLICATGGRSRAVTDALRQADYDGFVDISEGMLGSAAGRGWIAAGLPVVPLSVAMDALPTALA